MESVSRQTAPVLEKMVQFVLWLVPTVEKLPRSQYFLLGVFRVNSKKEAKTNTFCSRLGKNSENFCYLPVWLTTKPFPGTFRSGEKGPLFFLLH